MVTKKVAFNTPPRAGTPTGIPTPLASPRPQRVTGAIAKRRQPPISPSKAETEPPLSKLRRRTPPQDYARPKKKPTLLSPQPEKPLDGFAFTFDTNGVPGQPPSPFVAKNDVGNQLPVSPVTRRTVRPGPSRAPRRVVPATPARRSNRLAEKTPLSTKGAREAATPTTFRFRVPPPPALLKDRRAPRNRPEALALEARQKALASVSGRVLTPYPKRESNEPERRHPFLLVNKLGAKPRLADLAKEQEAYERFARWNKWERAEGSPTNQDRDPMSLDVDPDWEHKWQRRSTTVLTSSPEKIVLKGDGTWAIEQQNGGPESWKSRFPETDEGPSPPRKNGGREPPSLQFLTAKIGNLGDHSDDDESIDFNMVKKIRELKAIFGPKWAARSLTDLGHGLLSVGLRGPQREKVLLARREARLEKARQMRLRRLRDSRWTDGNGPLRPAPAAAKVERLPRRARYRYGDDNRAVFGEPTDIDPDFWKYLLGHQGLAEYSPEDEHMPDIIEKEEGEEAPTDDDDDDDDLSHSLARW